MIPDPNPFRVLTGVQASLTLTPTLTLIGLQASRLYFKLGENLAPFMFEIPRSFGAYDALFDRLGAKDTTIPPPDPLHHTAEAGVSLTY